MLILVLGKSYPARRLADYLAQNKDNIVFFTGAAELATDININPHNTAEIKEFIAANDIQTCIVADSRYIDCDYTDVLNETECCVLCPDAVMARVCQNVSSGKKFAYKNKIKTPRFAVFEKSPQALDCIQTATFPLVIMPDAVNDTESPFIAETKEKAKNKAEELFQTGNRRILIENYIEGYEYTKYIISDGINVLNLFETVSYFDETSTNNTSCIPKKIKEKIDNETVPTLLNAFMEDVSDFQGILGISFIIGRDDVYFSKFKSTPSDLDIDIMLNTIEEDLTELLYSASNGTLIEKYSEIKTNSKYAISTTAGGEIISCAANTMRKAIELMEVEGAEIKNINEAIKFWTR